jgi:hypothetical protein
MGVALSAGPVEELGGTGDTVWIGEVVWMLPRVWAVWTPDAA